MKAIVIDIERNNLIVLTKKGNFKRIYNYVPECQIGDEIELPERARIFGIPVGWPLCFYPVNKIAAAVIIFLLLFGLGGYGIADYMTPVAFVTIDINPSLELAINRYERVLKVDTFNDEGSLLAGSNVFNNMRLEDAVKKILDRAEDKHYLDSDSVLMFTISSTKNQVPMNLEEKLSQAAEESVKKLTNRSNITQSKSFISLSDPTQKGGKDVSESGRPGVQIIVQSATIEKHEEASKMNISVGKLLMYESLKNIKPEITLEEVKKSPVSKIIEEMRKAFTDKKDHPIPNKQIPSMQEKPKPKAQDKQILFIPDKKLSIPDKGKYKDPGIVKPSVINSEKSLTENKNDKNIELKVLDHNRENPGDGKVVHPADKIDKSPIKPTIPDSSNKEIPKPPENEKKDVFKKNEQIKDIKESTKENTKEGIKENKKEDTKENVKEGTKNSGENK